MAAPPNCGLPRSARMLRPADFARARREGGRATRGCLVLNWLVQPAAPRSRLGVITSRKVGAAVVRNRARRLVREVFRHHQHRLARPMDLVVVARPSIARLPLRRVERDFLGVLGEAGLLSPAA